METHKSHAEHDQNKFVDLFTESHDAITQQKICNGGHNQSQIELPKKTGRHSIKYMVAFCTILACVVISVTVASILSTDFLMECIPSAVEEQLSNRKFLKQSPLNVTNGELKNHIDNLRNDIRTNMEDFSNKTKMKIGVLLQTLPNKTDFDAWKEETRGNSSRFIHAMRCMTDCFDKADGDYQSCFTCNGFIKCSKGNVVNQTCATSPESHTLYWDDFRKECLYKSSTCDSSYTYLEKK